MTINMKRTIFAQLAALAVFALTLTGSLHAQNAGSLVYAQTTAQLSTSSQTALPITGLSLTLPAATKAYNTALVTLDMPNLYVSGTAIGGTLAGGIGILLSGVTDIATSGISCDTLTTGSCNRSSTIVVEVSLLDGIQSIEAVWNGANSATINTSTFASLSALLVNY
jgi:hypothetical protein